MSHVQLLSTGVTFSAWRGNDSIPLVEILVVIGNRIVDHEWLLERAEFVPGGRFGARLEELSVSEERVSTVRMLEMVSDQVQLIDGAIVGFADGAVDAPDIVIKSVRGDSWDVYSRDEDLLHQISSRFGDAIRIPV